jgi:hypothetical protein
VNWAKPWHFTPKPCSRRPIECSTPVMTPTSVVDCRRHTLPGRRMYLNRCRLLTVWTIRKIRKIH